MLLDGDGQLDPADLPRLSEALAHADLVAGYLDVSQADRQSLLETLSVEERLRRILIQAQRQLEVLDAQVSHAGDCIGPDASAQAGHAHRRPGSSGREVPALAMTGVTRRFAIRPEWRDRYAPGVTENLEHLWYLELPEACGVTLNPNEHAAYRWMGLEQAIDRVASWTNREALERLRASFRGLRQV